MTGQSDLRLRRTAALVLRTGGAALIASGLVVASLGALRADAVNREGSYAVTARADLASLEYIDPQAPAVPGGQVLFLTPGTAQSALDSLGTSNAFASAPYPGDTIASLPGTINGLGSGSGMPPVPDYPFLASSSHPTKPDDVRSVGLFNLEAHSKEMESASSAHTGAQPGNPAFGGGDATSHVSRGEGGVVVAEAVSRVNAVSVNGVLDITGIAARAKLTAAPGQAVQKEQSLTVAGMTVAGTPVTLGPKGLTVQGNPVVPAPDTAALQQALTSAGVELTYVPAAETENTVRSASIRITYTSAPPGGAARKVTLILGQVSASASAAADGLLDGAPGDVAPSLPADTPSGSGVAPADGGAAPQPPETMPSAGTGGNSSSGTIGGPGALGGGGGGGGTGRPVGLGPAGPLTSPTGADSAGAPSGADAGGQYAAPVATPAAAQPITSRPPRGLYLALVVAGVAAVVGSRVMAGVRMLFLKSAP